MVKDLRERILPKLAFRYWLKNKSRSSEENWRLAEKLLNYIEKRKKLVQKILK